MKDLDAGRVVALARPPVLPEPGTVVQIAPSHNWAACFGTIIKVGDFGAIVGVAVPHTRRPFAALPEAMRASLAPTCIEIKLGWDEFEPLFIAAPYDLPEKRT